MPALIYVFQACAQVSGHRKELVIHSYNQEFPWTKGTDQSFRETIDCSGLTIEYYTEYLDTKRTDRAAAFAAMEAVFEKKSLRWERTVRSQGGCERAGSWKGIQAVGGEPA